MKKIFGIVFWLILSFMTFLPASALTFNVVVLPVELNNICENYYCYPEVSEIVAQDLITYFNSGGKVHSPALFEVRKALTQNVTLKNSTENALKKFGRTEVSTFLQ